MNRTILDEFDFFLGEGSMYERLRRNDAVRFDPHIAYASLIYKDEFRRVFEDVHREYLDIGQGFGLPMIATTPTWRANTERISRSDFSGHSVNRDCAQFMLDLRESYGDHAQPIVIAGQIGPRGDGYLPDEAPSSGDAETFHRPQIDALAESNVDFLIAKTLPAVREALGIAHAMAHTNLPYVLSFVVRRDGTVLDGTPLDQAVEQIDAATDRQPAGYSINCVHASIFTAATKATRNRNPRSAARLFGLDANTSAKDPEELDGLFELDTEAPEEFGKNLWLLQRTFNTKYLGGCCGSSTEHIKSLAKYCSTDA